LQISVIIPVYNAARFVEFAVNSALQQPETSEVILVEDGSKDDSYRICQQLTTDPRVKLFTHPGHENQGASSSRNLGIRNATSPYIAFLDADDTYSTERFSKSKEIFSLHPDADGTYETIGVHYHNPEQIQKHLERIEGGNTGIRIRSTPANFFRVLATGKYGHVHLDGLVIRKSALEGFDVFDTRLVLGEDVDFILRLAATRQLYGGDPNRIVALRGVHDDNTVFHNPHALLYRRKYLQKCIDHDFYGSKDLTACLYIVSRRVGASPVYAPFRYLGKLALPFKLLCVAGYLLWHPRSLWSLMKRILK